MNIRQSILLMLVILAAASFAGAEKAPAHKTASASASAVAWTSDDAKNIRVEVEEEDGVSKVKVYEMKDGKEVLVKEYETTGDPHEMLELDGGDGNVLIMRADDDGHTWTTHGGDNDAIRKLIKIKGHDAAFFGGTKAFLGIRMMDLNEQLAAYFGAEGVLIEEVVEDSPAAEAGLKAGDVITKIDGDDIADADDVSEFMSGREKGDEVEVKVRRNGKNKSFKVTLSEQEAQAFAYSFGDDDAHFNVHDMPHMEHFAPKGGEHEVIMRRLHGGDSEELENLRADVEELKAMIEELKKNK